MSGTGAATGIKAEFPGPWSSEQYCYLATTGRVTGRPHEIEIWFVLRSGLLYMISGRSEDADWVKNLKRDPNITIRVRDDTRDARARVVEDASNHPARRMLAAKYRGWQEGDPLSGWAAEALLVEVAPAGIAGQKYERRDDA